MTDHGLLDSTLAELSKESEGVMETIADKGYECEEDMVKCLEDGIIPHVITDDGKNGYELEISYKDAVSDIEVKDVNMYLFSC